MDRLIRLKGNAEQRGHAHGVALKREIHEAVSFYRQHFAVPDSELSQLGQQFAAVIQGFDPQYAREIEAIAEAADIDKNLIYAVNARSELFASDDNECTALSFPDGLLAQTWDWYEELYPLYQLLHITNENGHRIVTMTEPGLLAKVGLNSAGIGVCLNFLSDAEQRRNVPVHILLRALLDCRDWPQVLDVLDRAGEGRSGHIFVADAEGHRLSIEYRNSDRYLNELNDIAVHTNHYLACDYHASTAASLENSTARLVRAIALLAQGNFENTLQAAQTVLSDQHDLSSPILATFGSRMDNDGVGTICTVLMDLGRGQLSIRDGGDASGEFVTLAV